ncbi:hypothetical protein FM019_06680 [Aliiglaciecola sp. M165]|nr:hypothetical protein FM019_06680 [Aliiglaciecola sp. M165]
MLRSSRVRPHNWRLLSLLMVFTLAHVKTVMAYEIVIDGSTGVKPLVISLANTYRELQPAIQIEIGAGLDPRARIQALTHKKIDIAMASHGIDSQQISKLGLQVHRIAKIAVVMGVHHGVDVPSISHQQLCDIYSGKINNWKSLGGESGPIIPFIRPNNEVDTEVIIEHVPCFAELHLAADIQVKNKSGQMATALAQTPGAIGMTTLVRVAQSNQHIIPLALNGIPPTPSNLMSDVYPLSRDVFLITASQPSPPVEEFLAFVRSESGANIIRANNAVPAK